MEDVLDIRTWFERPGRSRVVDAYVRRPAKRIVCRNMHAYTAAYPSKASAIHVLWGQSPHGSFAEWVATAEIEDRLVHQLLTSKVEATSIGERFRKLADEWASDVSNVSSVEALTLHPKYQQIVGLGWDVVPFLLADLQAKRGFWFTALNQITGVRPFDRSDAGNSRRMAEGWIRWGKRKGII